MSNIFWKKNRNLLLHLLKHKETFFAYSQGIVIFGKKTF